MKLKDRIKNIKTLLGYCSNEEVPIIEEKTGKFFSKFFNGNNRFTSSPYDPTYVTIGLATHILNDKGQYGLMISYCYSADRDGEEWADYYFDDPNVDYEYDFLKPKDNLRYSDIPDWVWKIIQDEIYKKATEQVDKDLKGAMSHLDRCTTRALNFTKELKEKLVEE